jgi:predicted ATPase/class 3 adenylate cyclase
MSRRKLVVPRFLIELKRRHVIHAAAVYIVATWVLVEVSSVVLEAFSVPAWVLRYLILFCVALFPIVLFLCWRYEPNQSRLLRSISDLQHPVDADSTHDHITDSLPEGISGSERRTISVLVCRLRGVEESPQAVVDQLAAQRKAIARIAAEFAGVLASTAPDEALICFGYPTTHEDDPRRALSTGLGILEQLGASQPDIAVTVYSGLAVVPRDDATAAEAAMITSPVADAARRLHRQASAGSLLTGRVTWHRAKGHFEGVEEPLQQGGGDNSTAYRVTAKATATNRIDLNESNDLTPLAGRKAELKSLEDGWLEAMQRRGQVALVSGEPGMGKSRLVKAIRQLVDSSDDSIVLVAFCSPYRQNSSLYPFMELLLQIIHGLDTDLEPSSRLSALKEFLHQNELWDDTDFSLLATALNLQVDDSGALERMSTPKRMQRTISALFSVLLAYAGAAPLLLILEDLHWSDSSSLALLGLVVDHAATSPLLALMTFRPEFSPPWLHRSHIRSIQLSPLAAPDVRTLLAGIPGVDALSDLALDAVVKKTDGVPLFVEEVARLFLDRQIQPGDEIGTKDIEVIPDTLQESLMARLDRLGSAKPILQLCAMLGREFSYSLLEAATGLEEEQLRRYLVKLLEAETLFQRGVPPRATYQFKHSLVQDAAYQSLLRSDRVAGHSRIARLLMEQFPELVQSQPETLARHFAAAEQPAEAARYYIAAATSALQKSADPEAAENVLQGLEQLEKLTPNRARDALELELRMVQGPAFMATIGFADPRTREVYERARVLSTDLQDDQSLIPILFGLWIHHGARGELQLNYEMAAEIRRIAEHAQDQDLMLEALLVGGCASFHMGELKNCIDDFDEILQRYQPEDHGQHAFMFGQDPLSTGAAYLASALWCTNQTDRALEVGQRAISQARKMNHPYSLALALVFVARVYQMNRDAKAVADLAGEALQVSQEFGFPTWQGFALILKGWADVQEGEVSSGLELITQGLELCKLIQLGVSRAHFLTMSAEAKMLDNDIDGALEWLFEAQAEIETHGTQLEQPETYRVRAQIERLQGNVTEADNWIERAILLARELGASAWEIRCLCEQLEAQGASGDKRRLAEILTTTVNEQASPDVIRAQHLLARP